MAPSAVTILLLALATAPVTAFAPVSRHSPRVSPLRAESVLEQNTAAEEDCPIFEAFPLPGDYGFDPLGLSKVDFFAAGAVDKARSPELILRDYSDAELRHGRLAMLAALGWPVQELLSPSIARLANRGFGVSGLSDLLTETGGRSPNVLNGGLEQGSIPAFLAGVAIGIGVIDSVSMQVKDKMGDDYVPGDFGFDPLSLLKGASPEAQMDMRAKEINNGRLAMVAVTIFVLEEFIFQAPITQLTPGLFHPLWDSPAVWDFLNNAFEGASAAQRIPVESAVQLFTEAQ